MIEEWYGFKREVFEFKGKKATLAYPNTPDKDKRWALKAEYREDFPETEIKLLENGFHVAWIETNNLFATKDDCDVKSDFCELLHNKYGLSEKCVAIGFSCGGAHAVNFAGFYPDKVACIFVDAPVLNFLSFPGKMGNEICENAWKIDFVKCYPGITRLKLFGFDNHPVNKVSVLKKYKIPIIMLYGTDDTVVDYNENGKLLELEYADCPELLKVIPRIAQGHHPHGYLEGKDKNAVVDFIIENS